MHATLVAEGGKTIYTYEYTRMTEIKYILRSGQEATNSSDNRRFNNRGITLWKEFEMLSSSQFHVIYM